MPHLRAMFEVRYLPLTASAIFCLKFAALALLFPLWLGVLVVLAMLFAALVAVGVHDLTQTRHAILRNYPIAAHLRFLLEKIRPEIAAAGLAHPAALRPHHFQRRASSDRVISFADQYEQVTLGQLLTDPASLAFFSELWALASANTFARAG